MSRHRPKNNEYTSMQTTLASTYWYWSTRTLHAREHE